MRESGKLKSPEKLTLSSSHSGRFMIPGWNELELSLISGMMQVSETTWSSINTISEPGTSQ